MVFAFAYKCVFVDTTRIQNAIIILLTNNFNKLSVNVEININ